MPTRHLPAGTRPLVYIAAPLFNAAEKSFNLTVDAALRAAGFATYLPQRDGGEGAVMVAAGMDADLVRDRLFASDLSALRRCDLLVMILDGRVPDEGTCAELGFAYGLSTPCFGLQTDIRRFADGANNLMIDYMLVDVATTVDDLITDVAEFVGVSLVGVRP